jgi:hypothetical protein
MSTKKVPNHEKPTRRVVVPLRCANSDAERS